jgi:hypothetical protein
MSYRHHRHFGWRQRISEQQRLDARTRRRHGLLFVRRRKRLVLLCGEPEGVRWCGQNHGGKRTIVVLRGRTRGYNARGWIQMGILLRHYRLVCWNSQLLSMKSSTKFLDSHFREFIVPSVSTHGRYMIQPIRFRAQSWETERIKRIIPSRLQCT